MKKRKILVSLALASASLFSLVACGGTEEPTTASSVVTTPSQTTPTPTATTPTPTSSSTDSNYEELTSTIDMAKDDIPAGKTTKDIVKGVFTIVSGSELRERTRTWTNPEDNTDTIEFTRSLKFGDDTSALKVNVAPGIDRVLSVYVQNGSSSANTQKIKVTKPDGSTYTIEYAGNNAFGGYPGSSVVVRIDIEVTDGEWKIQRNSGTTDLYAAELTGKFEKSEITGFEIAGEGKTEYMVGEDYSSLDVVVNAVYGNGRRDPLSRSDFEIDTSELDMNAAGTYQVKVKYGTFEAKTINVTVTALSDQLQLGFYRIEKLAKNTTAGNGVYYNQSVKLVYNVNEELDKADLSVKAQSDDGKKTFDIPSDDAHLSISNVDMTTSGKKTVTVTYELGEVTATSTFDIYVVDTAPSIVGDIVKVKVDKTYTGEIGAVQEGFNMFTSIQQALDFLENNNETIKEKKKLLSIGAGKYKEKLEINIPYLTIEGASKGSTIIEWDSLYGQVDEGGFTHTTDSTQTVAVRESAVNCTINNLTISNYWNNYTVFDEAFGVNYSEHRALALLVQSDKLRMEDVALKGYQDTVEFFTGRQYLKNCDIYGTTDFIFGTNNTTLFENCLIHTIDTGKSKDGELQQAPVDGGYTTAFKGNNKDANDYVDYGAIFYNCKFEADEITAASHNTSLGRPWGAYAAVAYINCELGEHFSTIGFTNSSKNERYVSMNAKPTDETVKFVEFNNYGDGAVYQATVEGTDTKLYGALAYVEANGIVPLNTYYELVLENGNPKRNADGTYVIKLTADTTFAADKKYYKAVTVSGYKFLTAEEAANYTDFSKIYGETNGKVTYLDTWDPTAEVTIKADSNIYYKFDDEANPTGTSYVMPTTFSLPTSGESPVSTATVGDMTFDATNGNIAFNANSHCVNMKAGAKLSFSVPANSKVIVKAHSTSYAKFAMNGVEPTSDTLIQFYATATDVELVSTGDTYISSITIMPDQTAPEAATFEGITISGAKDIFDVNDEFVTTGLVVKALYSDNTAVTLTSTDYEVDSSNVHMDASGKYTVSVTYNGDTKTYEIQVGVDLTILETIGTSFKGTKWGSTYPGLIVLENAIDATTEAKVVNNMTFVGFKSNGGNPSNWLKAQSSTNTITFDVAGPCKLLISYYNSGALTGTTVKLGETTLTTTDTVTAEGDICSYEVTAAGTITITTATGNYLGMVYVDMSLSDSTGTSYKGSNYAAYTNINAYTGTIDSTSAPVFLDGVIYSGGVKSNNSAQNWLSICNNGTITFNVAGPCKLLVAYYNADSMTNTTVSLGTTSLTADHLENRSDKTEITELRNGQGDVAVYNVTAAGKITISFTGSGYLGMVGVDFSE